MLDVDLYNVGQDSWSLGPNPLPSGYEGTLFLNYNQQLITFGGLGALAYNYTTNEMWTVDWPDGTPGINYGFMGIPVLYKSL